MNDSFDKSYEDVLRDGITAAKNEQRRLAQSLLRQAIMLNGADARPYVWLSATTDDPAEKREYLEMAVSIDPNNTAARRGLALLAGKIDAQRLQPDHSEASLPTASVPEATPAPAGDIPAPEPVQTFICPNCGGRTAFQPGTGKLVCEYCGFQKKQAPESQEPSAEGVLDFVVPTVEGQGWARANRLLSCSRCGASLLLQVGQVSTSCPYCGSNAFVDAAPEEELVEPQGMIRMALNEKKAAAAVRKWLGSGFFAPDDLLTQLRAFNLRPAYYSFWQFDGTLFLRWSCEVQVGSGRYAHWESRTGTETRFLREALVSGSKLIHHQDVEQILPFDLKALETFNPEFLAGWSALVYNRSLADASLIARERLVKQVRRELYHLIEPGREKRNISTGGPEWSGMTFKHLLLPLWVGTYHYAGKEYALLVNGQTGKVGGARPRDTIKIVLVSLIGLVTLALLLWLGSVLLAAGGA
jgi:DNA-directed RNA polymerase subunit RPC12/RpoP